MGDPDAIDESERLDVFRQNLADDHGDLSFCSALVFAQFGQPAVTPVLGSLRFPQNGAASLAQGANDSLEDVPAEFPFGNRLNRIAGKFGA